MSPRDEFDEAAESSAPQINPYALGGIIGGIRADISHIKQRLDEDRAARKDEQKALNDRLDKLPCADHAKRLDKVSGEQRAAWGPLRQWIAKNWKLIVYPVIGALLAAPSVKGCIGEQATAQLQTAVKRLEARPATKVMVVPDLPTPVPVPAPNGGE